MIRSGRSWLLPLAIFWLGLISGSAEWALRKFRKDQLPFRFDEGSLAYRFDGGLGWFPREDSRGSIQSWAGIRIHYRHNHLGFRDREYEVKRQRRVAFLGDSNVWGYDVEQSERFTDRLQASQKDWEVLNLGVSGYGTDQEYLLLRNYFDRLKPDIVVVVFCENDHADNSSNQGYGGYYKPYFVQAKGGQLELRGIPIPKSISYFYARFPWLSRHSYLVRAGLRLWTRFILPPKIVVPESTEPVLRELRDYLSSRRVQLWVAAISGEPSLAEFCKKEKIPFIQLPALPMTPTWHWSAPGHAGVAKIFQGMLARISSFGSS